MRRLLIVSVAMLLVLSVGAWLMDSPLRAGLRPKSPSRAILRPDGGASTETIVRLMGTSVDTISLERQGQVQRLRDSPHGWMLTLTAGGGSAEEGPAWPVDADRVRALLRLLGDARGEPAGAPPGPIEWGATLTLRGDGLDQEVALTRDTLAGQALVRVRTPGAMEPAPHAGPERWYRMPDDLHRVLVGTGLSPWRSELAFAMLPVARPSRIQMARSDARLTLARLGEKWTIREPISAVGDTAAVDALVRTLAGVRVREFPPGNEPEAFRPGDAHAVIRIESDRREEIAGETVRLVLAQEVAILGTGGVSGETVRAITQITETNTRSGQARTIAGPVRVMIDGAALAGLRFDPVPLATRRVIERPDGDVVRLSIRHGDQGETFERSLRGWARAGEESPVDGDVARAIDAFLRTIADEDASGVRVGTLGEPWARVELDLLGGERVACDVGRDEGAPGVFMVGDASLVRSYPADRLDAIGPLLARVRNDLGAE